jgi:hypothetical protein
VLVAHKLRLRKLEVYFLEQFVLVFVEVCELLHQLVSPGPIQIHFMVDVQFKLLGLEDFHANEERSFLSGDEEPTFFLTDFENHVVSLIHVLNGHVTGCR